MEIRHRVGAAWEDWKKSNGVFCDRNVFVKLKAKLCRTVVRLALVYGAETWTTTKNQENTLEVNGIRMLLMECGVKKKDKIRN